MNCEQKKTLSDRRAPRARMWLCRRQTPSLHVLSSAHQGGLAHQRQFLTVRRSSEGV